MSAIEAKTLNTQSNESVSLKFFVFKIFASFTQMEMLKFMGNLTDVYEIPKIKVVILLKFKALNTQNILDENEKK